MSEIGREKELVLAPNEFAYVLDRTKGNVVVYVGAYKASLSTTDASVIFDYSKKKFIECSLEKSIQTFPTAPEGWYLILKNPAKDNMHPKTRTNNDLAELQVGRKINIPGPDSFPLFPGQMVKVCKGHHLRSNQYLVVRVYDEEAARQNWYSGVVKPQTSDKETPSEEIHNTTVGIEIDNITMGKTLVIKGTEVSFYIPPTGVEVVAADNNSDYVRDAVTLERLEYCILLDEDGNKRYIQGPAVVFPEPTEKFIISKNINKFRAIELNEISGIYVKVIAEYEEDDRSYKVGEELFITGNEQMIYYPRQEHAIIKYGEQVLHYAVAIPAGEARYVLNRLTGEVTTQCGPCTYLPDPRKEVIVKRVLTSQQVNLWYPGNQIAKKYNEELSLMNGEDDYIRDTIIKNLSSKITTSYKTTNENFVTEGFNRKMTNTPPRSITLDTKYEGAVCVSVWTGYAIQVVSKTGTRKVIVGPASYILNYDETLEILQLSMGNPKNNDSLLETVYLRVKNNKVSDTIIAETKDYCEVRIKVSYSVDFENESETWFNVENYVKLLCDRNRSLVRNIVKSYGIEEFHSNSSTIVREIILNIDSVKVIEDKVGRFFTDNNMRVKDVDILDVEISDDEVNDSLIEAQRDLLKSGLDLIKKRKERIIKEEATKLQTEIDDLEATLVKHSHSLNVDQNRMYREIEEIKLRDKLELKEIQKQKEIEYEAAISVIHGIELDRHKARLELELEEEKEQNLLKIQMIENEANALVKKAQAITPQMIAALQQIGDKEYMSKVAEAMAPLAILGGNSVSEVFNNMLKGSGLEKLALSLDKDAFTRAFTASE